MDFDAYSPTWSEAPWVVLDNLRLILQTPMDSTPTAKERELKIRAQQAELELFEKLPPDLHFFFPELLRLARTYTSLDDLEHYQTTRLTPAVAPRPAELGRAPRQAGRSGRTDGYFLRSSRHKSTRPSRRTAKRDGNEFKDAVRQQKEAYLQDKARKPEWIPGREANPPNRFQRRLPHRSGRAVPARRKDRCFWCSARMILRSFPKGAVLVARTTNPTWTPLFYSAVAVVTESGGPLSHGAVYRP